MGNMSHEYGAGPMGERSYEYGGQITWVTGHMSMMDRSHGR